MSVSGIAIATANNQQLSTTLSGFQQDFRALVNSLKAVDLSGAQQAFTLLNQLQGNGQGPSANPNSPFAQALSQIGNALASGNLSAAQQALSSLQQARGNHHHGNHGGSASMTSASTATSSALSTANTGLVNITA